MKAIRVLGLLSLLCLILSDQMEVGAQEPHEWPDGYPESPALPGHIDQLDKSFPLWVTTFWPTITHTGADSLVASAQRGVVIAHHQAVDALALKVRKQICDLDKSPSQ